MEQSVPEYPRRHLQEEQDVYEELCVPVDEHVDRNEHVAQSSLDDHESKQEHVFSHFFKSIFHNFQP